ncbi:helix-turn-helix domain-containing protein [Staphylococcus xylosus]|uniref:helix-turn-helix domain-containing protein n=1 Tax=Staphylococcus xylosus TaxID=1288 RepID=UPI001F5485FF|nr:helix-turn-helix transcriptional regulator [Staphylococcus xylosus]HDP5827309.1 helix-turn-helix transcriptional regulator [Staphylococcus aureus]
MSEFKDNLKAMRKRRGLTQSKLAELSGLSGQIISNYERAYSRPNEEQIRSIAKVLNCQVNDLIDLSDIEIDYEKIMFSDKKAFDDLPDDEKARILQNLQEQADFMVERAKRQ